MLGWCRGKVFKMHMSSRLGQSAHDVFPNPASQFSNNKSYIDVNHMLEKYRSSFNAAKDAVAQNYMVVASIRPVGDNALATTERMTSIDCEIQFSRNHLL